MTEAKEFYDRYWDRDGGPPPEHDPLIDCRWQALSKYVTEGDRVLDFGCGGGIFSKKLVAAGCEVVGVDVAELALERARERAPEARFVRIHPGGSLPSETFDCVWASEVLEHAHDPGFILCEFARVLPSGGKLLLTVPYHGLLKNLAIVLLRFDRHFDPGGAHIRFFTREGVERLARQAGFRLVEFVGLGRIRYFWKSMFLCFERA